VHRPNCPGKRELTIPARASHRRGLNMAIRYTTRLEQAGAIISAGPEATQARRPVECRSRSVATHPA